jgi:hypothetical protein
MSEIEIVGHSADSVVDPNALADRSFQGAPKFTSEIRNDHAM